MAGDGLGVTADQGDADDCQKYGNAKYQRSIHTNILQVTCRFATMRIKVLLSHRKSLCPSPRDGNL